ncbi:MAG TPA: hypothetical protein VMT20_07185 [Terriglobia bacterium]|nr:hypothetical protein [Terriglobia bacterium]
MSCLPPRRSASLRAFPNYQRGCDNVHSVAFVRRRDVSGEEMCIGCEERPRRALNDAEGRMWSEWLVEHALYCQECFDVQPGDRQPLSLDSPADFRQRGSSSESSSPECRGLQS